MHHEPYIIMTNDHDMLLKSLLLSADSVTDRSGTQILSSAVTKIKVTRNSISWVNIATSSAFPMQRNTKLLRPQIAEFRKYAVQPCCRQAKGVPICR